MRGFVADRPNLTDLPSGFWYPRLAAQPLSLQREAVCLFRL